MGYEELTESVVSGAPQGMSLPDPHDKFTFLLAHADDNMILAQRLGEWVSSAPELEIDIALGNMALDHLGVARALYTYAGEVEGKGRDEDDLAMFRSEREFTNLLLVEQPNGDFAHSIARQLLFDTYQLVLWEDLSASEDIRLAGIAAKALKETRYHLRFSSGWMVRLGDGTDESHRRAVSAVEHMWRFTAEMFEDDAARYRGSWETMVAEAFDEATMPIPSDSYQRSGGRSGFHTEHLGHLLAEMQWMQRSHPGLEW
jgi:ring-1,2-phenylacetyl-CoA epoxidase subunit PaaC